MKAAKQTNSDTLPPRNMKVGIFKRHLCTSGLLGGRVYTVYRVPARDENCASGRILPRNTEAEECNPKFTPASGVLAFMFRQL